MSKHVLITGVTKGLGHYLAEAFAARGWRVTGTGRTPEGEASLRAEVAYRRCDMADPSQVDALLAAMAEPPDLLVNNAATYAPPGSDGLNLTYIEHMIRVNAVAPFLLSREILLRKDRGRQCTVVMINSEAAYHTNADTGPYSASKATLLALTRALADEIKTRNAAVATLVLGPMANDEKRIRLRKLAADKGMGEVELTALYLRKWNPSLVVDDLIPFQTAMDGILFIEGLGAAANGMVCRLDGGSSGVLY